MTSKRSGRSAAVSAIAIASILVVVVVAGGLSYYVFASMNGTTANTGPPTTASSTTSQSLATSSLSTYSGQTGVSTTTSSASQRTTSSASTGTSTSATSSSSGFQVPAGGSEIVIPEGIQDTNAKQENITFDPYNLKVVIGVNNTVYFYDADLQDNLGHVIESNSWPSSTQPFAFDILPGRVANVTLTTPGTYNYNCEWHPSWMVGTITVVSG